MQRPVKFAISAKLARCAAAAMLATALSSAVSADDVTGDSEERESSRFAFGLSITSGVLIQGQAGASENFATVLTPNPYPTNVTFPAPFRPRPLYAGYVNAISPNVGVNVDFMTPALTFLPAEPRLFATAEILPTFASPLTVVLDGAATDFVFPRNIPPSSFPAEVIGGTGSRLDAEVMTTVVATHVGASFDLDVRDRRVRIRPSVGWIRWGVLAEGKILQGFKDDPVPPNLIAPFFGPNLRLVEATGRGSRFFNAVGPGLEVEMDLPRRGSIRPVLYVLGAAYYTIGEKQLTFSGTTNTNDALGTATYTGTWTLTVDDWSYRAGLGFRLRWVGK